MNVVRTRIAPSPTGFMHIGTLRTALFNIFLAKQHGGQFLIRIEDTDQKREVAGAVESLLKTFSSLGLGYDEGPRLDGSGEVTHETGAHGPYVQSKRLALYREHAERLLAAGYAYRCFCTTETLEEMRAAQSAAKQTPKYDRRCLALPAEQVAARVAAGERHVVRMKVPDGVTTFTDAVRGEITIHNKEVDDQVLVKSDGFPTYHLAVVVDDHLMRISHVLRGEEWLPSTPKQLMLYAMFGWEAPIFAHIPLLLNPDKKKLSKRQGDVAVEDFLAKGYLPEALLNFVATLGFNPSAEREIYSMEELAQLFDLGRVNKSGAILNLEKLDWFNRHYLRALPDDVYIRWAQTFGVDVQVPAMLRAAMVERLRIQRLDELAPAVQQYFATQLERGEMLVWKKSDATDAKAQLDAVARLLQEWPEDRFSSVEQIDGGLRAWITERGVPAGNVLWPLRVALSGREQSASPFEYLYVLGKGSGLERIHHAISLLQ